MGVGCLKHLSTTLQKGTLKKKQAFFSTKKNIYIQGTRQLRTLVFLSPSHHHHHHEEEEEEEEGCFW